MKAAMLALLLVVTLSAPAAAEWGLYVNRDNQSWKMEQTFAFDKDCQAAAQAMWKTGTVKGVACQEYSATSFARRGQAPASAASKDVPWKPPAPEGPVRKHSVCNSATGECVSREYSVKTDSTGRRVYTVEDNYTPRR